MSFGYIAVGVGMAVSAGVSAYEGNQQGKIAHEGLNLAYDTQWKQDQYNSMLMDMMGNPGKFFDNPVFKASLNQGLSGVARTMAAQGFKGSGNEATALEQFGQSTAWSQFFQQEELLGSLSGAGQSAAAGLPSAVAATKDQGDALGGIAGMLAFAGRAYGGAGAGGGGGGGGGTGTETPMF